MVGQWTLDLPRRMGQTSGWPIAPSPRLGGVPCKTMLDMRRPRDKGCELCMRKVAEAHELCQILNGLSEFIHQRVIAQPLTRDP